MSRESSHSLLTRRTFLQAAAGVAAAGVLGWPEQDALASGNLQARINAYIQSLRQSGRIPRDERTAWSVYDFTTGTKLVSINEERPLQAASMIKPFVAQAYFYRHSENRGRFPYDQRTRLLMTSMIRDSSNTATNQFIDRVSDRPPAQRPRDVEQLLRNRAGSIFQQTSIVEYIPPNGRTYRNRASARDYSRFLFALWNSRLPFAEELKYHMGLPNGDRIKSGAAAVPNIVELYHKTGSTAQLCGDMGIVMAPGRNGRRYPYTFIGIIEKSNRTNNYSSWIRDRGNVIREVSSLTYQYLRTRHPLV